MSKPIYIALDAHDNILATFMAASPALSFAAAQLTGDVQGSIVVDGLSTVTARTVKALSSGMPQGGRREFRVTAGSDCEELKAARLALANAERAIAALPAALPEAISEGMLAPLREAVEALESDADAEEAFVTIVASQPLRRAYGTVHTDDGAEEPSEEPTEPETAPETAADRAAQFKASVGLAK